MEVSFSDVAPHVVTILLSGLAAWGGMRERLGAMTQAHREIERRLGDVEEEQDDWRATSRQLATATADLTQANNRLDRVEAKVDRVLELFLTTLSNKQ